MKRFLLFALTLLSACQSNTKTPDQQKATEVKPKTIEINPAYKEIIEGEWYESTYIEDLAKTKSPRLSSKILKPIVELRINTLEIDGDSLEVDARSIHEGGGNFSIFFKPGIVPNSFPTNHPDYQNKSNFHEFGYVTSGKDTSIVLYHYNKNKQLIDKTQYKKAPKIKDGAVQYMVNKTLFSGKYKVTDETGKTISLQLTDDGEITGLTEVSGLGNFLRYYVITDFLDPENNKDAICFDITTPRQKSYAFEIKGNGIYLYENIESEDELTSRRGQLKYTLIRQ